MTELSTTIGFRINLNKVALESREEARRKRFFWVWMLLYFMVLGAILAWGYRYHEDINAKLAERRQRLADINAELSQLQKSPRYVSEEDVRVLAALEQNRLLWTPKLAALAEVIPAKAVYTKMSYDQDRNLFQLEGLTEVRKDQKELDFVLALIDSIRADSTLSADFLDVDFDFSKHINVGEQRVLEFGLVCKVRSPEASASSSEPQMMVVE
ncbi:MAG: hypothetical protein D6675_00365 [Gemmatimonadetes bacterium]|nr:MAG: hypothetical protein D6675_00365 [Gemmatimonadota bacterium]